MEGKGKVTPESGRTGKVTPGQSQVPGLPPGSSRAVEVVAAPVVTPGDALGDFGPIFLDRDRCREWVISKLHRDGYRCPTCQVPVAVRDVDRYLRAERIRCASCRRQFTAWTATQMSWAKMDPREVVLLAFLIGLGHGISDHAIASIIGRSATTVMDWRRRFEIYGRTNR